VEREAEGYAEHLVERWRLPLVDVAEARLEATHAVMHPLRHRFQLEELLEGQGKG